MKPLFALTLFVFFFSLSSIAFAQKPNEPASGLKDFSEVIFTPIKQVGTSTKVEMKARAPLGVKGFTVNINEKPYEFYDNGEGFDKKAGDNIFTSSMRESFGKGNAPLPFTIGSNGEPIASPKGCHFKTIRCWTGCKSIIFGTACRACFSFGCSW